MKILSTQQMKEADRATILHEPIASVDLMERAARAFIRAFMHDFPDRDAPIVVGCGPGNNGGDGLAVARMLHQEAYTVAVYTVWGGAQPSPDCQENLDRIQQLRLMPVQVVRAAADFPAMAKGTVVIDALFGAGLSRPLEGLHREWVDYLNATDTIRVAIDLPSGLPADGPVEENASTAVAGIAGPGIGAEPIPKGGYERIARPQRGGPLIVNGVVQAHYTYTFQTPKLAFFAPENAAYVGRWQCLDIGLLPAALAAADTPFHWVQEGELRGLLKERGRFDHKGVYGHSLLVAGSYGKVGAAILGARAALRTGCGWVTAHVPRCGYEIMQIAFPEAMVTVDRHREVWTDLPPAGRYDAIGVGPGIGTNVLTKRALAQLLETVDVPLVLDADALNLLAQDKGLMALLPKGCILTPHPGEFERLFGKLPHSFARWEMMRQIAMQRGVFILLKGGNTVIATPTGQLYWLTTGNPGMATAGAGDVLTGMITSLLAQGYTPEEAALLGAALHGVAGNLAAEQQQMESLIADDIIAHLGGAFASIRNVR
ncbi:MAG: NAD(P)H-hydrate dehydratase [Saprospiraceae bacterium]